MAYTVIAYIVMDYVVLDYTVMDYIVMAYVVMAHAIMAYVVMVLQGSPPDGKCTNLLIDALAYHLMYLDFRSAMTI